jgi:hypothetical protein
VKAGTLALKTFRKISQLTWEQSGQDQGLKWEKINSEKRSKRRKLVQFYNQAKI